MLARLLGVALLSFPLALAAGGCAKKPPPPLLRVGYSPHDHHSPLYVAALKPDYFRGEGGLFLREVIPHREYELLRGGEVAARVQIDDSAGGEQLIRKLAEDQFDVAFGGIPAMIHFIDQGSGIRIVAPVMAEGAGLVTSIELPVSNWEEFIAFVRRAPAPVRIGYKIGRSVQNLIFEQGLRAEGISFAKELGAAGANLVLLNLEGQQNLIPALKEGFIDGFVANQPLPAQAVHAGTGKLIANLSDLPPAGRWQGNPCCALAAGEHYAREHSGAVTAFVTLMLRANVYIQEHPEDAALLIAEWLGVPQEVEVSSLPTIKFTTEFDPSWERGIDFWVQSMLEAGEINGEVRRAYESGGLAERIYLGELFDRARRDM